VKTFQAWGDQIGRMTTMQDSAAASHAGDKSPQYHGGDAAERPRAIRRDGLASLLRMLWDPSQTSSIAPSSRLLRVVEVVSLLLNLLAFYLIVIANKKLFKDPAKGGYGTHTFSKALSIV
jgi:hypothetical protein